MNEIVILMGPPGCGKSTLAREKFPEHRRINRDDIGGHTTSVDAPIYQMMRTLHKMGETKFILDNTHPTRQNRSIAVTVAKELGFPIKCYWVEADIGNAQFLSSWRQVQRFGTLPIVSDYKSAEEPWMFPPAAHFRYFKLFEEPSLDEGFTHVERIPFKFEVPDGYTNKALILDFDGTLRVCKSGDKWPVTHADIEVLPNCAEVLKRYKAEGYLLLGASNQSGINRKPGEKGYLTAMLAADLLFHTTDLLGVVFDAVMCAPDRGGPPQTFWRKPCTGIGAVYMERFKLNPADCIKVGDMKTDQTFAARCGFQFEWAVDFFKE